MAEAKGSRSKKHIRLEKPRQDVLAEPEEKKKRRRGGVIRRRWMTNTLAATFAIVAVAVSVFAVAMNNYYTSTIMATLESRAQTVADMFQDYTESYYRSTARDFVNSFEEKDNIEVQFLNSKGRVLMSSLLDISGSSPDTLDVNGAINTKRLSTWEGTDPNTGDSIMAASAPVVYNGKVSEGRNELALDRGFYIVNGTKVIVR